MTPLGFSLPGGGTCDMRFALRGAFFSRNRLGHIATAKVCKDKVLLICIIIIIIIIIT